MSENKMTPTPWKYKAALPGRYMVVQDGNEQMRILNTFADAPADVLQGNIRAIVSAVNGTYGKGIHPDAVEDLFTALKTLQGMEAWISDRQMKELFQKTVYGAIEKAKL